jgi:hypothetical protein
MDLFKRDYKLRSLRTMQKELEKQQGKFQRGGGINVQLNKAVNNILEHLNVQGKLKPEDLSRIETATKHIHKTIQ